MEAPEIEIRLREYDTLREEILMRIRTRFELLGVGVAIIGIVTSRDSVNTGVVLGLGITGILVLWGWLGVAIRRCARRLTAIEAAVNEAFGELELLGWETAQEARPRWQRLIR